MRELEQIEANLRRLADELAALRKEAPGEEKGDSAALLAGAAPAGLQGLLSQAMAALASRIGEDGGVQVLITGLQRAPDGHTTTWYVTFSDEACTKVLHSPTLSRALEAVASRERLSLLFALASGASGSAEAMERSGLSQGQFYHHLRALEGIGMVRKKARDQYQTTLYGTASLFTILAAIDYILRELPLLEEETP